MGQRYTAGACMQEVLTTVAADLAQAHGFRAAAKLGGAGFARTLVFGFLAHPEASLQDLAQMAGVVAEPVTPQAVDERFTPRGARFLQALLEAAAQRVVEAREPAAQQLLRRFTAVELQDSTTIALPKEFENTFRGCHGSSPTAGRAAVKFQVRLDLLRGGLSACRVEQGRDSDYTTPLQTMNLRPGSLHLRDLGYFDLTVLETIAREQAFFLCRLHDKTGIFDRRGTRLDLRAMLRAAGEVGLDRRVCLGVTHELECRLVAVRVPSQIAKRRRCALHRRAQKKGYTPSREKLALCDWSVYVTNAPRQLLSVADILVLARMRWQIELLFKQWKSDGRLAHSRSAQPWRILCEVFAKMIALIMQHWIQITTCWRYANRSLRRAAKAVRRLATALAMEIDDLVALHRILRIIAASVKTAARIDPRRKRPNAYQLLQCPSRSLKPT
jgi:Transposase DDE domain